MIRAKSIKTFVSTSTFGENDSDILSVMRKAGLAVSVNPLGRKLSREELIELARGAVGLIAGTESINSDVLHSLKDIKVISRCGAGMENVDIDAANNLGIKVFNTPDAPTLAVAELTIALILNVLRRVNAMDMGIRAGNWKKLMGNLLHGKKIGIVGYGRIGKKVDALLRCFGCETAYTDPNIDSVSGSCNMEKDALIKWADIITLHISGKQKIIGDKELGLMKKGAWLINVSRGGAVDEGALYKWLKSGKIAGAGIDVFEAEPYKGPLKELNSVVLTPHVGSYAKESRIAMERQAVDNLLKGLGVEI